MILQQRQRLMGSAAPMWLWVLAVVAGGSFVVLVGYMESYQTKNSPADANNVKPSTSLNPSNTISAPEAKPNQENSENSTSTKFDFYSLLPGIEKIISDQVAAQKPTQNLNDSEPSPSTKTRQSPTPVLPQNLPNNDKPVQVAVHASQRSSYFLQAGSFKDFRSADSRRAKLALIGIESEIQKANIPKRGLWHRVRIGPFLSLPDMRRTRKRLKNNNIKSIMLTVKK